MGSSNCLNWNSLADSVSPCFAASLMVVSWSFVVGPFCFGNPSGYELGSWGTFFFQRSSFASRRLIIVAFAKMNFLVASSAGRCRCWPAIEGCRGWSFCSGFRAPAFGFGLCPCCIFKDLHCYCTIHLDLIGFLALNSSADFDSVVRRYFLPGRGCFTVPDISYYSRCAYLFCYCVPKNCSCSTVGCSSAIPLYYLGAASATASYPWNESNASPVICRRGPNCPFEPLVCSLGGAPIRKQRLVEYFWNNLYTYPFSSLEMNKENRR